MTPQEVAKAWHSVKDVWIVRRNKTHSDGRQWEVVHDWGIDVVSEATMKIVDRFENQIMADRLAKRLEDFARGNAVLSKLNQQLTLEGK